MVSSTVTGGYISNERTISGNRFGILVSSQSALTDGITNSGTLSAITGNRTGIRLDSSSIGGSIYNQNQGIIAGDTSAGILLNSSTLAGGIANVGTLSVIDGYYAGILLGFSVISSGINNSGTVSGHGSGIAIFLSTASGGLSNSGLIRGLADNGISIENNTFFDGNIVNLAGGTISGNDTALKVYGASTITGAIINSGTASAIDGSALGIYLGASTLGGSIVNEGRISGGGGANNIGIGISLAGGYLVGSIVNQGTIGGVGTVSGPTGTVRGLSLVTGSQINGITNSGTISAGGVSYADAIYVKKTRITQGITNSGTASAIDGSGRALYLNSSTLGGSIVNEGRISSVRESAIVVDRLSMTGGISNSGTIIGGAGGAIYLEDSTLGAIHNTGIVTNSGTVFSSITVDGSNLTDIRNIGANARIEGPGAGISVWFGSSLSGGITNTGTIAGATYAGIYVIGSTITGGITNSGTIRGGSKAIDVDANSSLSGITIAGNNAKFIGAVVAANTPATVASAATYTMDNGQQFTVSGFTNAGTLKIGATTTTGSIGTITGNFTNTGTFSPVVASNGNYGKLVVSGNATLGGMLYADAASVVQGALTDGSTLAGVITANSVTGTFSGNAGSYDNSDFYDLTPVYGAGTVGLTIAAVSQTPVLTATTNTGNTPAAGSATVFDGIITNAVPVVTVPGALQMTEVITALDALAGQSDQALSNAVTQTLPLLTGGSLVATGNALSGINRVIQARQESNHGLSSGDGFLGDRKYWMKPFGSWASQDDIKGVSGFDANTWGIALGADTTLDRATRLGVAFAYAKSSIDSNSSVAPQSADVAVHQLIGYGSYSLSEATEFSFQVDYGLNRNKGRRSISFVPAVASADYDGSSLHLGVGLGHTLKLSEATTLTPAVRLDYTRMKDDAYTESGAGALNLNVAGRSAEEGIVGVDAKLAHKLSDRTTFTANLGVGYDVIGDRASITSAYAGAPGASFATYGLEPSPWSVRAGLGVVYQASDRTEITARYDAEHREDFLNQTASVKLRWAF